MAAHQLLPTIVEQLLRRLLHRALQVRLHLRGAVDVQERRLHVRARAAAARPGVQGLREEHRADQGC